ncbi:uncharacterized protein LOC135280806 isoform X2 [Passer domesticus]|uniref:uncharacterized protein LOC135280806 isoform X2 n=1 Tax=Passer domesticus TaxID=48849 RepID=UPI0030FEEDB6
MLSSKLPECSGQRDWRAQNGSNEIWSPFLLGHWHEFDPGLKQIQSIGLLSMARDREAAAQSTSPSLLNKKAKILSQAQEAYCSFPIERWFDVAPAFPLANRGPLGLEMGSKREQLIRCIFFELYNRSHPAAQLFSEQQPEIQQSEDRRYVQYHGEACGIQTQEGDKKSKDLHNDNPCRPLMDITPCLRVLLTVVCSCSCPGSGPIFKHSSPM